MTAHRFAITIATAAYVFGMAAQTTFVFFLVPTHATRNGVADAQMLAYGIQALAATVVGLSAGRLTERVPRRRVMRLGWGLVAAGITLLALGLDAVSALVLGSILVGAGLTYGFVAFHSYLPDLLRSGSVAQGFARTGAAAVLGAAVAPFVAGRILAFAGGEAAALFVAGLALVGLLITFPLRAVARGEPVPQPGLRIGFAAAAMYSFDPRGVWRGAGGGGTLPYLVAFAILGLGYGLCVPWMGPYLLERYALAPDALGTLVAAATALGALAILLAGWLAARSSGALKLALAVNGAHAATLVAFALAPTLLLAGVWFLLRQFTGNPTGSILNAGLASASTGAERSMALGATNIAWNLPWAIGAFAGGALRHSWGEWLFVAGGALVVVGPAAALLVSRRGDAPRARHRPRSA